MPTINRAFKEISCKIVYYGPGLGGKTTNLQIVHRQIPGKHRGELVSLATEQDRTLFFDFLPLDLGEVKGFKTKFQLYTVPGQVFYNATRKLVLRGVDGLVFVADSQADRLADCVDSFKNLNDNLQEYGLDVDTVPIVLQYNKRDLPNILDISDLDRSLNPSGKYKTFEAVACDGVGVKETLKAVSGMVLSRLNESTKSGRPQQAESKLAQAAAKRQAAQASAAPPQQPAAAPISAPTGARPAAFSSPEAEVTVSPAAAQQAMSVNATRDMDQKPARFRQESKMFWRGLPAGRASLEFSERRNVDNRGDFLLAGIVKGFIRKTYWYKMLEKAPPPPGSQPNLSGLVYFRERGDSNDQNPPIEAWISPRDPQLMFIRQLNGSREISPIGRRLREIIS